VICRDAVGSTGEDDAEGSLAPVVGVIGGVNSTRVTWRVSVVRTRCDSEDPVADTLCTRTVLLGRVRYLPNFDSESCVEEGYEEGFTSCMRL